MCKGADGRRPSDVGVVGGNFEDQMKPLDEAVAAAEAVLAAARHAGIDNFVLNARTDAALRMGDANRANVVEEVVRRGRAFLEAGAPVVFVPRLFDRDEIRTVVDALGRQKLSVMSVPGSVVADPRVAEPRGGTRVHRPFTQRVALTALQEAAAELLAGGTLPEGIRALN